MVIGSGFQTDYILVFTEPDIFGPAVAAIKTGRGDDFLREVSGETGDLVVHAEHGIGRYEAGHYQQCGW